MNHSVQERRAYVSLLYGEEFCLGMRVLGQSILLSDTDADLVALVAGKISGSCLKTIQDDGWIIKRSEIVSNPTVDHPKKFSGVYTKLMLFGGFSEYEQVIFLDADTIVVKNIDHLFLCDGFCAVLRHSERFNTGVMAIKTDASLVQDMLAKVHLLPSYTGGDQGFLNEYMKTFACSPMFYPDQGVPLSGYKAAMQLCHDEEKPPIKHMGRIPTTYNADLGLFVLNHNRWPFEEDDIRVIHYTLGPVKPWKWWSLWALGQDAMEPWIQHRNNLQSSGSCIFGTDSFWRGVFSYQNRDNLLGLCLWAVSMALGYRHLLSIFGRERSNIIATSPNKRVTTTLLAISPRSMKRTSNLMACVVGYCSVVMSVITAFAIIPTQVCPWTGYFMAVIIVSFTFPLLNELFWYHIAGHSRKSSGLNGQRLLRAVVVYLCISILVMYPPWITLMYFKTIWSSLSGLMGLELVSLILCGFLFQHSHP